MRAPTSTAKAVNMERPPLPFDQFNPFVKELDETAKPPAVKFQEIVRDGQATIVGRIKIPTPLGHAFILRRLDTGAISLTTMFRAAFPSANDDTERAEAAWVKLNYDVVGANKSGKARFAGTWVTPEVAMAIAASYSLESFIAPLADAVPDPNIVYRKSASAKAQQATPASSPAVPSMAAATPKEAHPTKRRREDSPSALSPAQVAAAVATTPTPAKKRAITPGATPSTRWSNSLKSPAPKLAAVTNPKRIIVRDDEEGREVLVGGDDDESYREASEVVAVAEPKMQDDIREQKELIERLKAEKAELEQKAKEAAEKVKAMTGESFPEDEDAFVGGVPTSQKRLREEASVEHKLTIKEPEAEGRAIATNSRIRVITNMPPERKQLAWGAVLFAAGIGAV
ncbi:hypothetical protein PHLCEN_2v9081 [Hermanssonia centrifuga]|uniref:HTH APSES-type domain-containing protein n=1 Tax=Hermanssonia centrifuga TaxID=98765 RepID=A0A2R6NRY0_9APHY|nr:hypothetical protein PHLCEN_2v9081 [Hermanssonia centrifuga]